MLLWFLQVQTVGGRLRRNVWRSWHLRRQSCPQQRWKRLYHWGESMGNLNASLLWEAYLQTRSLRVHMHQCARLSLGAWSTGHCSSVPICILQAVAHRYTRNWFRVPAKLADMQQSVRTEVPSFLNVDCERKWRATHCLANPAFQLINPHSAECYQHGTDVKLPSYQHITARKRCWAASIVWYVSAPVPQNHPS